MVTVTVMAVDTDCPPNVAVTCATPPMTPEGASTPLDAPMVAIWPRSIVKEAGTGTPPAVTVNVRVGSCAPNGTESVELVGVMASGPLGASPDPPSPSKLGPSELPAGPSPAVPSPAVPPSSPLGEKALPPWLPQAAARPATRRATKRRRLIRGGRAGNMRWHQLTTPSVLAHFSSEAAYPRPLAQ